VESGQKSTNKFPVERDAPAASHRGCGNKVNKEDDQKDPLSKCGGETNEKGPVIFGTGGTGTVMVT